MGELSFQRAEVDQRTRRTALADDLSARAGIGRDVSDLSMMTGSGDQCAFCFVYRHIAQTVCKINRLFEQFAVSRLSRIDCDLDCGIRAEIVPVVSSLFPEPIPNSSLNLPDKSDA